MSTVVKDLGAVSAYAYAVEKGYTGTEAEFAELMADYAEVGQRAEDAADRAEAALDEFTSVTADATTLPEGSSATAEYSDGHLTFGIPKGDKGDTGAKGDGAVYAVIGNTSSVIPVGTDGYLTSAYTITIPVTFYSGKDNVTGSVTSSDLYISRSSGGSGEMDTVRGSTYRNVQTATIIYAIPAGWRVGSGRITLTVTIGTVTLTYYHTYTIAQTGSQGEQGIQGPIGATPNLTIGTVTTLQPSAPATATITGTADNPVLSFGIPKGDTGEVSQAEFDEVAGDVSELKNTLNNKANTDGSYEQMTVGNAEQLVSTVFTDDNEPYNFRTAGGNADIGDRLYEKIVGGTLAWNQLIQSGNFDSSTLWFTYQSSFSISDGIATVTPTGTISRLYQPSNVILNHKYLMMASFKGTSGEGNAMLSWYGGENIFVPFNGAWQNVALLLNNSFQTASNWQLHYGSSANQNSTPYQIKNAVCFDLTAMFGSTIADYIYSLETANAGAGVAWFRKLFPKDYYAYDAGSLQSVQAAKHVTVGFNQFDKSKAVNASRFNTTGITSANALYSRSDWIKVIPNTTYYFKDVMGNSDYGAVFWYDAEKNYISASTFAGSSPKSGTGVSPSNAYYMGINYRVANEDTVCVNLHWDGERDGEYEAYNKHEYPLADLTLRGIPKLDASNHLYYDGDIYESDGTVTRRYKPLDLSTQTSAMFQWITVTDEEWFGVVLAVSDMTRDRTYNIVASKLFKSSGIGVTTSNNIYGYSGNLYICISASLLSERSMSAAIAYFTNNPIEIIYPLATPVTEEAAPFQSPQVVDDFGTEEYVDAGVTASTPTRDVAIPVGHESKYSVNLRAKLEMAPDSPSDGDGDYLVRQTSGENEYVKYVSPVPAPPSENGTYTLKVTVSGSTKTVTWVADT